MPATNPKPEKITIPVADLALFNANDRDPESTRQFLDTWDYAFRSFGFVFLVNHGLENNYNLLHAQAQEFFQLPLDEKLKFRVATDYGHGGFIPQGQENVSRTFLEDEEVRPADAVESLATTRSKLDSFPCKENGYATDELMKLSVELKAGLDQLTIKIMQIMARCLELPEDHFLDFYKDSRAENNLRIAHYLPVGKDQEGKQARYGEHTDYTGFTFLWRNQDNGLQCLNTGRNTSRGSVEDDPGEKQWIDIPILEKHPDALIVNAGDLIQRWTNDYWISNIHRVLGSGSHGETNQKNAEEPLSIVFFTGPKTDTKISVLSQSEKVSSTGPVNKNYQEEVTAEEHLWRKINASNK